jgi:peptide/nickel transport system substrate-binding protein
MAKQRKLTRREFLRVSAVAAAGAVTAACAGPAAPPAAEEEAPPAAEEEAGEEAAEEAGVSPHQAPELQELVKAGELPPLDERLPMQPKVLSPGSNEVPEADLDLTIGTYGGVIRMAQPAPEWNPDAFVMCDEPLLSAPGILAEGVIGGVAESFETSDDGTTFTFHMRKGLKWSDGEPVTTEDVQFTYEDILMNEELTPTFPKWMKSGNKGDGEPLKVEIVDEYTFRVMFPEPYEGFPAWLAIMQWKGYTELVKPKHYLKQFHPTYTPLEELEPLIAEEELSEGEWWTLFHQKDITNWELCSEAAIGFPNLQPWMVVEYSPTATVYERNPYYFKVDAEGNQLPYINGLHSSVVEDVEMSQMKVIAGEVDFMREDATLDNLPLYKENEEAGGYRVQMLEMHVTPVDAQLNLTYDDPTWREVVRDVRFRKALSLAVDRMQIIDTIYKGFAEPATAVPGDYDPDQANALLDEMGMTDRDDEGYRLGPDGETFEIPFEVSKIASDIVPVTELYVEYWKDVGIKATMNTIDNGLRATRRDANELQATMDWQHGPELWWGALWDYIPTDWGPLWWDWFNTGGQEGEEPPEEVKEFMDLMDRSVVVSGEERDKAIEAYRANMYENVWIIITCQNTGYPMIVSQKLRNIPTSGFAISANFSAEQFYFEE